jgi:hypothetical protein
MHNDRLLQAAIRIAAVKNEDVAKCDQSADAARSKRKSFCRPKEGYYCDGGNWQHNARGPAKMVAHSTV